MLKYRGIGNQQKYIVVKLLDIFISWYHAKISWNWKPTEVYGD